MRLDPLMRMATGFMPYGFAHGAEEPMGGVIDTFQRTCMSVVGPDAERRGVAGGDGIHVELMAAMSDARTLIAQTRYTEAYGRLTAIAGDIGQVSRPLAQEFELLKIRIVTVGLGDINAYEFLIADSHFYRETDPATTFSNFASPLAAILFEASQVAPDNKHAFSIAALALDRNLIRSQDQTVQAASVRRLVDYYGKNGDLGKLLELPRPVPGHGGHEIVNSMVHYLLQDDGYKDRAEALREEYCAQHGLTTLRSLKDTLLDKVNEGNFRHIVGVIESRASQHRPEGAEMPYEADFESIYKVLNPQVYDRASFYLDHFFPLIMECECPAFSVRVWEDLLKKASSLNEIKADGLQRNKARKILQSLLSVLKGNEEYYPRAIECLKKIDSNAVPVPGALDRFLTGELSGTALDSIKNEELQWKRQNYEAVIDEIEAQIVAQSEGGSVKIFPDIAVRLLQAYYCLSPESKYAKRKAEAIRQLREGLAGRAGYYEIRGVKYMVMAISKIESGVVVDMYEQAYIELKYIDLINTLLSVSAIEVDNHKTSAVLSELALLRSLIERKKALTPSMRRVSDFLGLFFSKEMMTTMREDSNGNQVVTQRPARENPFELAVDAFVKQSTTVMVRLALRHKISDGNELEAKRREYVRKLEGSTHLIFRPLLNTHMSRPVAALALNAAMVHLDSIL